MVFKRIKKGGILFISDGGFLLDENLEKEKGFRIENIVFLKMVLDDLKNRCWG